MVSDVERAYPHYAEHKSFTGHFGGGANGVVVGGPGGSIAFDLGSSSADASSGIAALVGIFVAAPGFTGVTRPDGT